VDTHVSLKLEIVWEITDMAMIELVDFNELTMVVKKEAKASRRGGKAKKSR
jgi:hypothetical protein